MKTWPSRLYALYTSAVIEVIEGRRRLMFRCLKCKHTLYRFLDTKDRGSTSNLRTHAESCWGREATKQIQGAGTRLADSRTAAKEYLRDGKITSTFKPKGNGTVSYSHTQLSKLETRCVLV